MSRVNIQQGPDGEPVVTEVTENDEEVTTTNPDAEDDTSTIRLVPGKDTIIVKHTYCYVAGNQTQYTTVGVEMVAQDGDTIDQLFGLANDYAAAGVAQAADTLTQVINNRRNNK
jgi:hypothetical protein